MLWMIYGKRQAEVLVIVIVILIICIGQLLEIFAWIRLRLHLLRSSPDCNRHSKTNSNSWKGPSRGLKHEKIL